MVKTKCKRCGNMAVYIQQAGGYICLQCDKERYYEFMKAENKSKKD